MSDQFESLELRRHFKDKHNVEIGLYSYGCFDQWRIPPGTRIGRYCSFSRSARINQANHPMEAISTHPYLYERQWGLISKDRAVVHPMVVEDDVWFGHSAVTTPNCRFIGRGAVIGAGSVVTRDVPRYAIVAGNPARLLRYRFEPAEIEKIEASQWWLLGKSELRRLVQDAPSVAFTPAAESLERIGQAVLAAKEQPSNS
jgi:acetyltransferase-like isoleucine patch superfamily enzyme